MAIVLIAIFWACENKPHQEFTYFPDGSLKAIIEDTDTSEEIKKIIHYNPNGKIMQKGLYNVKSGTSVSKVYHYDSSGVLEKISSKLIKGEAEGEVIYFNKEGNIDFIELYENRKLIYQRLYNDCGGFESIFYYNEHAKIDSLSYVHNGIDHLKISHNFLKYEANPDSISKFGQKIEVKITKEKVFDKLILITGWVENSDIYGEKLDSLVEKMDKSIFVKLDTFTTSNYNFTYLFTPTKKGKHLLVTKFIDIKNDSSDCYSGKTYQEFIVK